MVACFVEGRIKLLLIRHKALPYQNCLALVGGFMDKGEDAAHACQREWGERSQSRSPLENRAVASIDSRALAPGQWPLPLVYLPGRALNLVQECQGCGFVDVDFQTGKCYPRWSQLEEQAFAFDHYAIIQESHQANPRPSRLESDLPLSVGGGSSLFTKELN